MRRTLTVTVLVVLCAVAFWGSWTFFKSPYYSLYQIGKAVHERNARLFLAYVDVAKIVQSQEETLVDQFVPKGATLGKDTRQAITGFLKAFRAPVNAIARDRVINAIADPDRDNIPSSWTLLAFATVTMQGDLALVEMEDPKSQDKLRLGMRRHEKEGHWQVVEANPEDVKRLIQEYIDSKSS